MTTGERGIHKESTEDLLEFICKEVSDFMDGSDFCCDYLTEIDDTCYEQCGYTFAQPACWKRYFTEKKKSAEECKSED